MRRHIVSALLGAVVLAGCATGGGEMKMAPAASGSAGIRFSRGEAEMLSGGSRGAVLLAPLRYNEGSGKIAFVVAAFNHAGQPINFGPEDVVIRLDDGTSVPVEDFDTLRHGAKERAQFERTAAFLTAAVNGYLAVRSARGDPYLAARRHVDNMARLDFGLRSIAYNLDRFIETARVSVLQTSTIDPDTYFSGGVVADQPPLTAGRVRKMEVTVTFAGEPHRFSLFLAPEGTHTPPQALPAIWRTDMETLGEAPQTWLFTDPAPAAPEAAGYEVGRF